ncbi:MAG: SDR family NAD(P)-dependent oxidoreductase [Actinomycetota bacterium]
MNGGANLVGKSAIILGASSPHGAATARVLAREGVKLALGGRDRQRLENLEAEIHASGGQALVVGTHLAKRHHPAHLVRAAVEAFGGVDALVFMARASAPPLSSGDLDAFERSVDVNTKGFLYCLAAALPALRGSAGHVVYLSSDGMRDPLLRAAQAAARMLLEESVREFSTDGLRASEVRLPHPEATDPEACARTVLRALVEPPGPGVSVFEVG